MSVTELITSYVDVIRRQQTFSASSVKSYGASCRAYLRWVCTQQERDPLAPDTLLAYYEYLLNERKVEPSSIKSYFAGLGNWCDWMEREGHTPANIMPRIKMAKSNPPIRLLVTDEEVANVLTACTRIRDAHRRALMTALLTVLTHTALRHKELLDLRVGDISLKERWLYVRKGKGGKKRQIALADECIAALQTWIALRPADVRHDYLWVRSCIHRIGYDALNPLIADVVYLAGYTEVERFKAHSIRHNAATFYYRQTKDLAKTKMFLGHSKLTTTERYIHTGYEEMFESRNATNRASNPQQPEQPPAQESAEPSVAALRPTAPVNIDLAARNAKTRQDRRRSIRLPR